MVLICKVGNKVKNSMTVNPAPALIPNTPGSASGFSVTACSVQPDSANPIPHKTARIMRGRRIFKRVTDASGAPGWSRLAITSE